MRRVEIQSFRCDIFIGGALDVVGDFCQEFCDSEGLCVHIYEADYIYTGGRCRGVKIGLINYGRFPNTDENIMDTAERLAFFLLNRTDQDSVSIVGDKKTVWLSNRPEDDK